MSQLLSSAPLRDGFWMPGEFERHAGCWMLWPERPDNWRDGALPAQRAFALVAAAISDCEPLTIGVSARGEQWARQALLPRVRLAVIPSDDAWMRDVGPTFVVDERGARRGVDWRFNAWGGAAGGVYQHWRRDDLVARRVLELERCPRYRAPMINEGGAIHVDGQGTVIVTEQCLLNPNRNPKMSRERIETLLCAYLGVRQVLWLGQGVVNDETSGHVDNLACFARPGEICLGWTDRRRDPFYRICRDALTRLMDTHDARGRRLRVHKLPMPGPLYVTRREARGVVQRDGIRRIRTGQRLAGSYVNFYLANRAVIAPLLDSRRDQEALRGLRSIFPERRVIGVPAREILLGGGNIHCITQQVPGTGRRSAPWRDIAAV